jgi:hypothetical protein
MKRGISRHACLSSFVFILFAAVAVADEGVATGKLTLGGKTAALTHAYAVAQPDTFDKTKENVLILLSDVAVPNDSLWDDFPGLKLAGAGQLHAILVVLNADRSVKSASILHNAFPDTDSFYGLPQPKVELKTFDGKHVAGTLSSGKGVQLEKKNFDFSATFSAPILHRPAPTATGAAAAQTAPGKVVLAFLKALSAGDKARMRKLMTAEYGKPLDGPQGQNIVNSWKANRNVPITEISAVEIHGQTASVVMVDKANPENPPKFTLALEGGEWKIDSTMM